MASPKLIAELQRLKDDESLFPESCSDEALQFFIDNDDGWYNMRAEHEKVIRQCGRSLVAIPKENPDGSVVMRENGKPELDFMYTLGNTRAGYPDVLAFYPSSSAGFAINRFCDSFKEGMVPVPDMDKGEVLKFKGCFEDESLEIVYYWVVGNQRKVAADKYACQLKEDDPLLMLMIPTPDGRHHIEFVPDDMLDTSGAPTEESNFGKKVSVDEYLENTFQPRLKGKLNEGVSEWLNFVVEFLLGWSAFHSELYNEEASDRQKPEVVEACKEVNKRINYWIDALELKPDNDGHEQVFLTVLKETLSIVSVEKGERGRAIALAAYFTATHFEVIWRQVVESGDDTNTPRNRRFVEQAVEVASLIKEVYKIASGEPLFEVERDEQRFPSKVVEPSEKSPEKVEEDEIDDTLLQLLKESDDGIRDALSFTYFLPGLLEGAIEEGVGVPIEVDLEDSEVKQSINVFNELSDRTISWASACETSKQELEESKFLETVISWAESSKPQSFCKVIGIMGYVSLRVVEGYLERCMNDEKEANDFDKAKYYKEFKDELNLALNKHQKAYESIFREALRVSF